ncbi:MAG: methionyl-tRNA formyltransferase [Clostridiales bacterium]|nr:methionyl-tRNA formyltransferase [Clostridiales bacterium]
MKVIFMGTPDFSVGALESIIEAGHEVVLVVTKEDKPKGRGQEMMFTPVKEAAIKHNIPVFQPHRIKDAENVSYLKEYGADIFIVVAYGQILSEEILNMPKYGCINVHASLLPKYRGAAPIQWAVINGEEVTGVTTMKMDMGIDTGDIIEKATYTLKEDETGGSLFDRLMELGGELIVSTMKKIEDGTAIFIKQNDEESTHTKMLEKSLGKIDFSKDAAEIERLVRGLNPWPSAYTSLNDKSLKIWKCKVVDGTYEGDFGEVVNITKNEMLVKTGNKCLSILELQLEGRKRMYIEDFLCGINIEEGTILGK